MMVMKELIRFDDETQRTFLKEVSGDRRSQVLHHKGVYSVFYSEDASTVCPEEKSEINKC